MQELLVQSIPGGSPATALLALASLRDSTYAVSMIPVVIDTNVFVAGLRSGGGASRAVLRRALGGGLQPLFGNALWMEYQDLLGILSGQLAYVAEVGETIKAPNGESDARLRLIYANGTESNLLRRSLQRALYKDDTGRRLTDTDMGPLFGDSPEPDDIESGTIYVLRSQSTHPFVTEHRELIHKIGVTGGKVETRIAAAAKDATYLLADVEIVATYKLHNLNRTRMENIFHRLFGSAQIEVTIDDRFGNPVKPREWFLVPLHVIDEAVARILDGSIVDMVYDPTTAQLTSIN